MTIAVVNLQELRVNRGLSIPRAAEKIGVSKNTLAAAESGDRQPIASSAFKIASFYGLKVTDVWPLETAEPAA